MQKRTKKIQVELTSQQGDTWTWRKVGAKQPRGEIAAELLPAGAALGDVLDIEAAFDIDGIVVESAQQVSEKEEKGNEFKTLELLNSRKFEEVILKPGKARKKSGKKHRAKSKFHTSEPDIKEKKENWKKSLPKMPDSKVQTKARKKLSPKHAHREKWLASLTEEQKPVAEKLIEGGMPAVRSSIEKEEEIKTGQGLIALAEELLPGARLAEWQDRADAALEGIDEVRLADLRTVLAAAEGLGKKSEVREKVLQLREQLGERVKADHAKWLEDINTLLDEGRILRALTMSSSPPKAGLPLPEDLAGRLIHQAGNSLTPQTSVKRWIHFLDAVHRSPVARRVELSCVPAAVSSELQEAAKRFQKYVPQISARLLETSSPSSVSDAEGSTERDENYSSSISL